MSDAFVARIARHPDYLLLKQQRNRLGTVLTALMLLVYFGFIALIAFDKAFLAQPLGSGVTSLGVPLGLGVIVFTVFITVLYVRRANHSFDALTHRLLQEAAQ